MCSKCNNTYWVTHVDYVPYGSTTVPMETAEPCDCLEVGCPECGGELDYIEKPGRFIIKDTVLGCECGWRLQ
jgi:hypothetical protein